MINKLKEAFQFYYYLKPFGYNRLKTGKSINISIFASPRGGSTWLAQILKAIPRSALVWEPLFVYNRYSVNFLNPFSYPERFHAGITWNQYIPDGADWPEAERFFSRLFEHDIVNLKLYRFNDLSELPGTNTFIYKFCYGNNLLPWLASVYNINPVFMLRHPCAVVASQLNYGAWEWHKDNFKYDYKMKKFSSFYDQYREQLESISCVEERLAAEWAMSVLTPVNHPGNDKQWVTVAYEHLLTDPRSALEKIFHRLPVDMPAGIMNNMDRQSFTKSSFEKKENARAKLASWKKNMRTHQIDTVLNFVRKMGVDFYSETPEPDYSIIYADTHA